MKKHSYILFGAPGCGKNTVCSLIKRLGGYYEIETGQILRNKKEDHAIQAILGEGDLVNDNKIIEIVKMEVGNYPHSNFILNGMPRTLVQAQFITDFFGQLGHELATVFISIDPEIGKDRILNDTTKKNGDREKQKRLDDNLTSLGKRIRAYEENWLLVTDHLALYTNFYQIKGGGSRDDVALSLLEVIKEEGNRLYNQSPLFLMQPSFSPASV